ncbi:MAG TPA: extracellular solute-binding protein [Albitalea sp.]|uniref:ABC transporter substrate-binding protein n=1 Tax=Piscinibacter sp. TaxID=1903157 RepID=UPI002ED1F53F
MDATSRWSQRAWRLAGAGLLGLAALPGAWAQASGASAPPKRTSLDVSVVKAGPLVPPVVAPPCAPGRCPFAGQTVTILLFKGQPIAGPVHEVKAEFEAATGARLQIVEVSFNEHFDNFISDVTNRGGRFDTTMAGAWWLGELVAGEFIVPYEKYLKDPRFPQWDFDDVLPAPRSLLEYDGRKYMVANDHDGQVMYYRRDLFEDPQHRAAFQQKYGYPLAPPRTWDEFRDAAEYFNGRDLNGDGVPDHGVSLHLKVGEQGMFHFMSFSAPFVIGPDNPKLYWFDPQTMRPLIESPGHLRALKVLMEISRFGPKEMVHWDIGQSWDHFLAGRAALTFTWGNIGGLAQEQGSKIKGKLGTAHIPGTREYWNAAKSRWIRTEQPNRVANVTGGSWAGVITKHSKAPEATYYLLALMATREKALVYAARGWDGIDAGRLSQFLAPQGRARIEDYLRFGWDEGDVRGYLQAFLDNFRNPLQLPFLRIPGTFSYWRALDVHLGEACAGQLSPEAALKAAAVDFEEITIRLGREQQRRAYRASLGL